MNTIDAPHLGKIFCISKLEALFIHQEVFTSREYLQNGITISPGDTIMDVGANIGLFTIFADRECGGNANIYAFEPIPAVFDVLSKNTARYCRDNIKLFNMGLTSLSGPKIATFQFYKYLPSNSTTISHAGERKELLRNIDPLNEILNRTRSRKWLFYFCRIFKPILLLVIKYVKWLWSISVKVECKMTTVSDIIREQKLAKVDLLKIDVEGAEFDVIQGITEEHWPLIRQISMEVHSVEGRLETIAGYLRSKGFNVLTQKAEFFKDVDADYHMLYAKR